ncbi:hypothetical protein BDF20DRAFT_866276 [Mycotypha africana]|uniref:uncharacterized protein n=1 Tax=Mycotypha africana TaxID=64632 RepID=UPI002301D857|nr:uncharacterized protein BDF20DRAFT_866276 [Mycotypha africana]KAI8982325.1 hypothetical protein BDF20DRAFT_866276 [Mycotypha africana]
MDLVARKKLNLDVLKRHDPNICDILDQSAHAVVYKFDIDKASWEKLGYEGVIFLTQGKSAPYFGLYILNRLSIENFSLQLTDFEEINLTDEFIIYQTNEGEACALWLFEKRDRERILSKILKLHEGIKALPSTQVKPVERRVDILQMLQKASNNPSTVNNNNNAGNELFKMLVNGRAPQQQQPQQKQQPTNMPVPQFNASPVIGRSPATAMNNKLQELFNNANNNSASVTTTTTPRMNHNNDIAVIEKNLENIKMSNSNDLNQQQQQQRRAITNGELTKPFYPPFMNPPTTVSTASNLNISAPTINKTPITSPNHRNTGSLLQALHGGLPHPPQHPAALSSQPHLPTPPPPPMPPMGLPLLPQQVIGLMRPEIGRRFAGRPLLSKPEFIQQLLNMIQCDPTFFEILYESYKAQMVSAPPPPPPPIQ